MNDITLPKELAEFSLSLEEIGAIFVMFAMPDLSEKAKTSWSNNQKLNLIIQCLIDDNIATISDNDAEEPILELDFTKF